MWGILNLNTSWIWHEGRDPSARHNSFSKLNNDARLWFTAVIVIHTIVCRPTVVLIMRANERVFWISQQVIFHFLLFSPAQRPFGKAIPSFQHVAAHRPHLKGGCWSQFLVPAHLFQLIVCAYVCVLFQWYGVDAVYCGNRRPLKVIISVEKSFLNVLSSKVILTVSEGERKHSASCYLAYTHTYTLTHTRVFCVCMGWWT